MFSSCFISIAEMICFALKTPPCLLITVFIVFPSVYSKAATSVWLKRSAPYWRSFSMSKSVIWLPPCVSRHALYIYELTVRACTYKGVWSSVPPYRKLEPNSTALSRSLLVILLRKSNSFKESVCTS